jgi:bifunctional DNA-binding transcriptional regulator/antitoxin component of YhaV-PrlF toxin-antitoxin module
MGRILLPVAARQRHGIKQGEELILVEDEQGLRLKTVDRAIEEAQALFARYVPAGVSLVEELQRERREEAERE